MRQGTQSLRSSLLRGGVSHEASSGRQNPWRFLDAGRLSARRLLQCRRPKTCTRAVLQGAGEVTHLWPDSSHKSVDRH